MNQSTVKNSIMDNNSLLLSNFVVSLSRRVRKSSYLLVFVLWRNFVKDHEREFNIHFSPRKKVFFFVWKTERTIVLLLPTVETRECLAVQETNAALQWRTGCLIDTQWQQQFHPAVTWDTNTDQPSVPSYSRVKFLPSLYAHLTMAMFGNRAWPHRTVFSPSQQ